MSTVGRLSISLDAGFCASVIRSFIYTKGQRSYAPSALRKEYGVCFMR
jgi:hypothetical protein